MTASQPELFGNIDAEKGIILGMLHYPDVRSGSALALDKLLFTDPTYKQLFPVLSDLGSSLEIDRLTLQNMAKKHGIDKSLDYLFEQEPPSKDILRDYYEIVRDNGGRQALEDLSQSISSDVRESKDSVYDIAERALDKLRLIKTTSAPLSVEIHSMSRLVVKAMESMEKCFVEKKADISGISTGLVCLDSILSGLNPGMLVIGSRPNVGIRELAINIALNVSNQNNVLYVASSMSKDLFVKKALAILSNLDLHRIRQGYVSSSDHGRIMQAASILNKRNLYVTHATKDSDQVYKQASFLKRRKGLDLVIVDRFQDLLPKIESRQDASFIAQEEVKPLEDLYTKLDLPVIVLSELSSRVDQRATTTRPRVGHLRDYGALEYVAQQIMLLYHEDEEDRTALDIDLVVNHFGFPQSTTINYDRRTGRCYDRARGIESIDFSDDSLD